MKSLGKTLLIPFVLFAFAFTANAQQYQQDPVSLGVKGGLNFSNYLGDNLDDGDGLTRANAGIFLNYDVTPFVSIQPEANLSWRGAEFDAIEINSSGIESGEVSIKQTFIEIPVLAKLQLPTQSGVTPNIYAGPAVSFSVSDEFEANDTDGDLEEIGLEPKSTEFALQFGAGLEFGNMMLDARYHLGLTDTFEDVDAQNGVFMLSLGLMM